MIDIATELKSIWYLLVALVGLSIWLVRLENLAKRNSDDLKDIKRQLSAAFGKIDVVNEELPVMRSKLHVVTGMLQPEKLQEFHTATATFHAETKKDIERLMDAARKAGVL